MRKFSFALLLLATMVFSGLFIGSALAQNSNSSTTMSGNSNTMTSGSMHKRRGHRAHRRHRRHRRHNVNENMNANQ